MEELNLFDFKYPIGYQDFHQDEFFNYTLNRWYSRGRARYQDFKKVGDKIEGFKDWKSEFLKLAIKAEVDNRYYNAFIYYRGAEFFVDQSDPDKDKLYYKSMDLFYDVIKNDNY